jgi:hypothetical protein
MLSLPDDGFTDAELDALERQIPDVARTATLTAHTRAVMTNSGVLSVHGGNLVRVYADGSERFIAEAKPRRRVTIGEVVQVRRLGTETADGRA